ncbi:Protein of unknown function [Pyronema omphalodes CBS 100304]|uniref:Uncharacterized protein n=1 Tax=Pyronema omphalodes (strain CBS 100304) TaxID=1076935 RepID=U4KUN0_PYROM|nr:Protein of unknown function [Pyronema omphalodes CBS 100304]
MNTLSLLLLLSTTTTGVLAGSFYEMAMINVTLYPQRDFKPHYIYTNLFPTIIDSGCKPISNDRRTVSYTVNGGCCEFYSGSRCATFLFAATDRKHEELGPRHRNLIGSLRCGRGGCEKLTTS